MRLVRVVVEIEDRLANSVQTPRVTHRDVHEIAVSDETNALAARDHLAYAIAKVSNLFESRPK